MANKAVFVDRDNTVIEDPGYVSDPSVVKLLPGVELAIRSLHQAGYKVVVVTNQSGIARGMLTEETLENIHAEMRRQLAEKGVHLDAVYYCPYHPEGTVDAYAIDSDLRKPKPGMLLKGAKELDLDLQESWMVGDSPRDVEAGQRAGCRTVRVRTRSVVLPGEEADEAVQADYTVRNLVDAARVILREPEAVPPGVAALAAAKAAAAARKAEAAEAAGLAPAEGPAPGERQAAAPAAVGAESMTDRQARLEILRYVRQLARRQEEEEFSFTKLLAGIAQALTLLALMLVFWKMFEHDNEAARLWASVATILQVMALTLFVMQRQRL